MYTIPTLSRTAMHYTYNTDTTDTVPDGVITGVTMFDGGSIAYSYDFLQRLSNRTIAGKLKETYAYAPGSGENTTTNRVSTKRVLWNNVPIHQFQHGYDALGNITNIYDAVTLKRVNYTYDDQGQLKKAVHIEDGSVTRTETYSYDNVGNITEFNNGTTSHTYTYGDTQWKDLLKEVDDQPITYDDSGNPTSYYNGYTMTWAEGRRLESVTVGGQTYTYQYNADGQRVKKTNPDGSYIEYYVVNGVTVGESHFTAAGNKTLGIRYTLDENNTVIGFTTGGVNYYFAKNLQGDVLEVYNVSTNEVVAQYTYDSWGNILSATGSIAEINPFRYRGYYYDSETGFYYLQSRYYDAGIGRFINADAYTITGQGVLGNNMYAYCTNDPVNRADHTGFVSISTTIGVGARLSALMGLYQIVPEDFVFNFSENHNCYSYAFGLEMGTNPGYLTRQNEYDYIAEKREDGSPGIYTLDEITKYVLRDMEMLGKSVRPVNSPSERMDNEYIVALKTSTECVPGLNFADYHFAVQLSDGTWADKQGPDPARWNVLDGTAKSWDIYPNDKYYSTESRYFAVVRN